MGSGEKNGAMKPLAASYKAVAQSEKPSPLEDESCGFFCLQPRWMRPLGNRLTYLLVYCSCGLIQGMWYTYFVSILTTVEKTFKFPSSVTDASLRQETRQM